MNTVAFAPSIRAASATPWAWLPALAATTPRARSAPVSREIRVYAPRNLNEPVCCRFSHFSQTGPPTRSARARECSRGVRRTTPSSSAAAASTSAPLTKGTSAEGTPRSSQADAANRLPETPPRRTVAGVTDPALPPATSSSAPTRPAPAPTTVGELRDSGAIYRSVKAELRANLLARLAAGEPTLPGIVGFEDTVVPEVERALVAGHDLVLLGERGQGKTRLIRTLIGLLDEWTPVLVGSELNEHPLHPISVWGRRQIAEHGDAAPVGWLHRSDRFGEKLATPDTSVGDLIGDVDPIKVAEGRTLGDPETVHYGLVPRTNRGVFSVNELPDLAERIQVALLNVLEERDIQIRGYRVRLPLDLLLVASANPEDYTNRGRIITPLKDRFGAEVRTHYPLDLADEIRLLHQEAQTTWLGHAG